MIKMHKNLCRLAVITALALIARHETHAQSVVVQPELDPAELANVVTGNGVQLLNPTISCADSASGTYDIQSVAGFPTGTGIVLSTGNIDNIRGPNNSESITTEFDTPGDPFLTSIIGNTTYDGCALEFDVVPVGDTLRFNFTFASEEYSEYVGTPFNDAFGFFISGPGIVGEPIFNGAENIALIPGTSTSVSTNNINNGNPDIGFPPVNPSLFNENPLGFTNIIQYDGWTLDLFAEKIVQPCDTFHLKLVIADGADREWDSAVFIEEIQSNNVNLSSSTEGDIENMIEGCNNGTVTFTREPVTDEDVVVTFFVDGTATNGTDYPLIGDDPDPNLPKFITIPANQASASIDILPFDDGVAEGDETVIFYVGNPNCVGTIQDSLIFTIQDSLNLSINPPLAFVCLGDSLLFDVQSEASTYTWSPGDFLDDPAIQNPTTTPTANITYTLEAEVASCSSTASTEIFATDVELSSITTDILCGGDATGEIDLTVTGAQSPIEYEWVGPNGFSSDQEDLIDLEAGTYAVLVTDRDGCTASLEIEISENPALEATLDSPTYTGGDNISCFGASDGEATASVDGGVPPYSFQWDDPTSQTGQTATGLSTGTYTVTITDANNCTIQESITLTQPEIVTGDLIERVNVLCSSEETGSAIIEAIGGNAPYTYQWNTVPPQSGPILTEVGAGFYTVTITDINGCLGSLEIEIEEPDSELSGTVNTTDLVCNGDGSGSATADINGGTPPYTYEWSSDPGLNQAVISDLNAGSYLLTVTDTNSCEISIPFNINEPLALELQTVSVIDVDCAGQNTGSATVLASGGSTPYSYEWNTDPITTGPAISSVSSGVYQVVVTDANACTDTLDIEISEPDPLQINLVDQVNLNCFGDETGSLEVGASGGTPPFQYSWNTVPPTIGTSLTNLEEGSYTVTVTDNKGCQAVETYSITSPDQIEIQVESIQNVLCSGEATGSVTVSANGGIPDYSFEWNDPNTQTGATADNLTAGTYTVTVTDQNSCTGQLEITITEPASPLSGNIINIQDVLCFGDGDGQATVEGTGGSGSYSYQWDDPNGQQTPTASGLDPGTYTVTITDNNGCLTPVELEITINGPTSPLDLILTPSTFGGGFNVACAGDSTATIDLEISGGTAPYDVLWNLPGLDTSTDEDLSDLAPGTYGVTVTDANGCEEESEITLTAPQPISIEFTTTPSLCFGIPSGSIEISIEGGFPDPDYDVSWSGPNGFTSSDLILEDLVGGIYNLTIEDGNGCIYADAITVVQPDDLVITVDSLSDFNGFNTTCWDTEDGAIYTSSNGGTTPYTFQWNTSGEPNISDLEDLEGVSGGTYELVLSDANGCVQNEFVELTSPDTLEITLNPSLYGNGFNISCFGEMDGSVQATVLGGTPDYAFTWTGTDGYGPTNDNPIENVPAGEYNLLVEDANGCTRENSIVLIEPDTFGISLESPLVNGDNVSCNGGNDGSIDLITTGGEIPFDVLWTGPDDFTSTDTDLFDLVAGEYCVTVTDANNCAKQECITLTEPDPINNEFTLSIFVNGTNLSCSDSNDGSITTVTTGGTAPYNYSWFGPGNFTSSFADIFGLAPGEYCLTVTDANGCEETECVTITAPPPIEIVLEEYIPSDCSGDNTASIDVTILGGDPAYIYSWTGPNGFTSNSQDISNLEPGTYCLELTDVTNCTSEACFEVEDPLPLSYSSQTSTYSAGFEIDCNGNNSGSISLAPSGGTPPYTVTWTGPDGFTSNDLNIDELFAGNYCLELIDANNCVLNDCIELEEPSAITSSPIVTLPDCGDGSPANIDLNVSGGVAPYEFNWSQEDDTEIVQVGEGVYSVIISDANNCSIEEDFNIILPSSIIVIPSSPTTNGFNIACNSDFSGEINIDVFGIVGNLSSDWTGPDGFSSTDANISGLQAGTYCVTVTDDLGCEGDTCITLTEPEPLQALLTGQNVSCSGLTDGAVSAQILGGVPIYNITWTGPNGFTSNGSEISGLETGTYCANVTDFNGCNTQTCIDITEPNPINIDLTSPEISGVNILCFGDNTGSIDAETTGGTEPYTFSWTGPNGYSSSDEDIANLFVGEYCLTITDVNNCEVTTCITLTEGPELIFTFDLFEYSNGFNISCNGECDGSLEASFVGGGPPPYTNEWEGPDGFSSSDLVLSDLCAGTYNLSVTDGDGCTQSASVTLTEPEPLVIDLESPVFGGGLEVSCFGESTGVINTTITGGIGDLNYSWIGPDGFVSDQANLVELAAGTYTLVVTDESGCSNTAEITLNEPEEALTASATAFEFPSGDNISCQGASDGSIESNATGGTPPYTYNWNGPNDYTSADANIEGLEPGEYTLVVEDINSCVFTINVTITEPKTQVDAELTVDQGILCNGDETGSLSVSADGGSPDYTILWAGPNDFTSTDFSISDLPSGTYTYVVQDINGCSLSGAHTFVNPSALILNGEVIDAECETPTGAIDLTVSGGTPEYTYLWNDENATTSQDLIGVSAGDYLVQVTDENGCMESASFTVETFSSLELDINVTGLLCNGDSTGSIEVTVLEGTEPVEFVWLGPDDYTATGPVISNLASGIYDLAALDANGCGFSDMISVPEPDSLIIEPLFSPFYSNGFNLSGFESGDGIIEEPEVNGGTLPYDYLWSADNGYQSDSPLNQLNLAAGTYSLIVTDQNMCTDTAFITLTQPIPLELPNGISPNGDGFNDGLLVRGLEDYPQNKLIVFNRWGNEVYEESNYRNSSPWFGVNNGGEEIPEGTYFVVVELEGADALRGYLELRR